MFKKNLLVLLTALTILTPSAGCQPQRTASHQVSSEASVAFTGAVAALEVVDLLISERIAAMPDVVSDEQFEWARTQRDRVRRMRDALAVARSWLGGKAEERDGRKALRDAVTLLQLTVDEMERLGIKIPDTVRSGLQAARLFV